MVSNNRQDDLPPPDAPPEQAAGAADRDTSPQDLAPPEPSLRDELDELQDRLLRALAEADNARKRAERARRDGREAGIVELAAAIVPALDDLALAIATPRPDDPQSSAYLDALIDGLHATNRAFLTALARFGVQQVEPKRGEEFDPAYHEAVASRGDTDERPGCVLELLQSGYSVGGRLVRPARVVVAASRG
jgi:molecular chaperone GrpE